MHISMAILGSLREQDLEEELRGMRAAAEELDQARTDAAQARTALGEVPFGAP